MEIQLKASVTDKKYPIKYYHNNEEFLFAKKLLF